MASTIYQLLASTQNASNPVSIGLLRQVLQEILISLPSSPLAFEAKPGQN